MSEEEDFREETIYEIKIMKLKIKVLQVIVGVVGMLSVISLIFGFLNILY